MKYLYILFYLLLAVWSGLNIFTYEEFYEEGEVTVVAQDVPFQGSRALVLTELGTYAWVNDASLAIGSTHYMKVCTGYKTGGGGEMYPKSGVQKVGSWLWFALMILLVGVSVWSYEARRKLCMARKARDRATRQTLAEDDLELRILLDKATKRDATKREQETEQ